MSKTNEQRWQENYDQLKAYVLEHHQLPNKKKAENRGLLNWWKYNQRLIRQGKLSPKRTERLRQLSDLRHVRELWT